MLDTCGAGMAKKTSQPHNCLLPSLPSATPHLWDLQGLGAGPTLCDVSGLPKLARGPLRALSRCDAGCQKCVGHITMCCMPVAERRHCSQSQQCWDKCQQECKPRAGARSARRSRRRLCCTPRRAAGRASTQLARHAAARPAAAQPAVRATSLHLRESGAGPPAAPQPEHRHPYRCWACIPKLLTDHKGWGGKRGGRPAEPAPKRGSVLPRLDRLNPAPAAPTHS